MTTCTHSTVLPFVSSARFANNGRDYLACTARRAVLERRVCLASFVALT